MGCATSAPVEREHATVGKTAAAYAQPADADPLAKSDNDPHSGPGVRSRRPTHHAAPPVAHPAPLPAESLRIDDERLYRCLHSCESWLSECELPPVSPPATQTASGLASRNSPRTAPHDAERDLLGGCSSDGESNHVGTPPEKPKTAWPIRETDGVGLTAWAGDVPSDEDDVAKGDDTEACTTTPPPLLVHDDDRPSTINCESRMLSAISTPQTTLLTPFGQQQQHHHHSHHHSHHHHHQLPHAKQPQCAAALREYHFPPRAPSDPHMQQQHAPRSRSSSCAGAQPPPGHCTTLARTHVPHTSSPHAHAHSRLGGGVAPVDAGRQ